MFGNRRAAPWPWISIAEEPRRRRKPQPGVRTSVAMEIRSRAHVCAKLAISITLLVCTAPGGANSGGRRWDYFWQNTDWVFCTNANGSFEKCRLRHRIRKVHAGQTIKIRHARNIVIGICAEVVGINEDCHLFWSLVFVPAWTRLAFLHAHFHVRADIECLNLQVSGQFGKRGQLRREQQQAA